MGNYRKILNEYKSRGTFDEDKMWVSVDALDRQVLEKLEESDPEMYWEFMRDQHEIFCGPHFDERFGKWEVEKMHHTHKGEKMTGAYWSIHDIKPVYDSMRSKLPQGTTIWDFSVALNANWHDKVDMFKEWFPDDYTDKIIEDAVNFYFEDDDAPDGKIWRYIRAMH